MMVEGRGGKEGWSLQSCETLQSPPWLSHGRTPWEEYSNVCKLRAAVFYADQSGLKVLQIKGKYNLFYTREKIQEESMLGTNLKGQERWNKNLSRSQMKLTLMVNGLRSLDITEAARVSGACCIITSTVIYGNIFSQVHIMVNRLDCRLSHQKNLHLYPS